MHLSISHQFCEVLRVNFVVEASLYDNEAFHIIFGGLETLMTSVIVFLILTSAHCQLQVILLLFLQC